MAPQGERDGNLDDLLSSMMDEMATSTPAPAPLATSGALKRKNDGVAGRASKRAAAAAAAAAATASVRHADTTAKPPSADLPAAVTAPTPLPQQATPSAARQEIEQRLRASAALREAAKAEEVQAPVAVFKQSESLAAEMDAEEERRKAPIEAPPQPVEAPATQSAPAVATAKQEPQAPAAAPAAGSAAASAVAQPPPAKKPREEEAPRAPPPGAPPPATPAATVPPAAVSAPPSQSPSTDAGMWKAAVAAIPSAAAIPTPVRGAVLQPVLEQDRSMWFFLVDIMEEDRSSRLYLFGKVKAVEQGTGRMSYQSCCFVMERMERALHLLLRVDDPEDEDAVRAAAADAEAEFDDICRRMYPGVTKLRAKLKHRNYAWEKKLPHGDGNLPFLKVVYEASGAKPNFETLSGRSWTHIFGATQSLQERLLTTRRIMGPSWLRLEPGTVTQAHPSSRLSFCALEIRGTPESIFAVKKDSDKHKLTSMAMPQSSPPLRVLSLGMQTIQRSTQHGHEPLVIVASLHPGVSCDASESDTHIRQGMDGWCGVRRIDDRPLPEGVEKAAAQYKVQQYADEKALFNGLLTKILEFEPDVITGYNAYGFDLDVIASRMSALNVGGWQRLGRLRRRGERMLRMEGRQTGGYWVANMLTSGRLVCDVQMQARDLLPKLGNYDLPNLAKEQLKFTGLYEVEPEALRGHWESQESLVKLIELTANNAVCTVHLAHSLQILPLTKQLTNLAGNVWNASLQNKRADRNEFLLCHEFHKKKFILPDKESVLMKKRRAQLAGGGNGFDDGEGFGGGGDDGAEATTGGPRRGKAQYSGGMVLEPKAGLYDEFIMMLDFNSLYPSVIQEFNVCFTTVDRPNEIDVLQCESEADMLAKTKLPGGFEDEGILPGVLRRLVQSRRDVKARMKQEKDEGRLQVLEIRQKAIKLTANSMYGTLGFQNSRFYAKPLAAIITAKGREALQSTITVVQQELSLDVVYGDTDSVFVNSKTMDYDQAMASANQIKRSVNKRYKTLEIEIDGIFGRLLMLKKKKYAALKVLDWQKKTFEKELKGIDVVRRDWCGLAKRLGFAVIDKVLSGELGKEETVAWIHDYLVEGGKEMDENKVPLEQYVITKGLTKAPKDYPDAKNQAHVMVALRLQERGKSVTSGQEVEYVICEPTGADGSGKQTLAERARHPKELEMDNSLKIDVAWYKAHQVHPVIARMLTCVEGTDAGRLAECLGMDGSRFNRSGPGGGGQAGEYGMMSLGGDMSGVDATAMLDRKTRFSSLTTRLPGVKCAKCSIGLSWEHLLMKPSGEQAKSSSSEVTGEEKKDTAATAEDQTDKMAVDDDRSSPDALFRCHGCKAEVFPITAQNMFTVQLRKLLRDYSECWVTGDDDSSRTRRLKHGSTELGEKPLLQELDYLSYLCESASEVQGGALLQQEDAAMDVRRCRPAAAGMLADCSHLLRTNGYNWVDCGKLFGGIFGLSAGSK
eukprot:TRINITY_DN216_c0_g1_i1.p1 TRINITY_DN216_c0_g1~~TRINITY_DN216_c0_g1_i1.p1  ORF type:complete len:1469 (-),score=432.52 TRINITY_DN216_c0_g1_i1:368-4774(-)